MRQLLSLFDHVAVRATVLGSRSATVEALGPKARIERLTELEEHWHRPEWLADPTAFFGPPDAIDPQVSEEGTRSSRTLLSLRWPSTHRALDADVAEGFARYPHNATAHGRWYRSERPRPTVILIHGYGGGVLRAEARVFPTRRWLGRGYDLALIALPFHGPRRAPRDKIRFPSSIPSVTIEGFRQAIADLRALVGHLLANGAPSVSVIGMSLGGYSSALLATVDPRLNLVMPFIPLASMADYAARHKRFIGTPEQQEEQRQRLERVYAVVSPLHRPAVIPPKRIVVSGGTWDRICPPDHAERLAAHFGCVSVPFPGAHLLQAGRRQAWRAFELRMAELDARVQE